MADIYTTSKTTMRLLETERFRTSDPYEEHGATIEVDKVELSHGDDAVAGVMSAYVSGARIGKTGVKGQRRMGFYMDLRDLPAALVADLAMFLIVGK